MSSPAWRLPKLNPLPPKRILFFISEDWYFWSHRRNIAAAAIQAGYEVWLATRLDKHGAAIRAEGINLLPLRRFRRRTQNVFNEILSLWELVRIYRWLQPHIVHHVALKPALLGMVVARLTTGRTKIVNALGGLGVLFTRKRGARHFRQRVLLWGLRLLTLPARTVWIVQNANDRKTLVDARIARPENAVIIPGSGADPRIFAPEPEPPGPPVVLLASRLLWPKGIEEFIQAARAIKRQGIAARFVIAGASDDENPQSVPLSYIRRWVQRGIIEYRGYIEDMPPTFHNAHLVCLPTYYGEGIPKFLVEAAACGIPAVASDIAGCREIVQDGRNGLTVPPGDVSALTAALVALITDSRRRMAMKDRARQIFLVRFSDAHIIEASLKVWEGRAPA